MIEEWRNIADYHEHQLSLARKKLEEIDPMYSADKKIALAPYLVPAEYIDFEQKLLDMAAKKNLTSFYTTRLVNNLKNDLVDNVDRILQDCRDVWALDYDKTIPNNEWNSFLMKVLEILFDSFSLFEHDFEDTAGCDEIVWDAGCDVLGIKSE